MKIVPALAVGAILLIWTLNSPAARRAPIETPVQRLPDAAVEIPDAPTPEVPPVPFDYMSLLASLPADRQGLRELVDSWCRLEEALLGGEAGVLEKLLGRYGAEVDPGYKGLLAVLLSADPQAHRRILEDHRSHPRAGWDLFHGMALLALVRNRPDSGAAALAPERVEWWKRLFRIADVGTIYHAGEVENRITGEHRKVLACSTSMRHLDDMFEMARECPAVSDFALRAVLLDAYTAEWDWDFARWLSRDVLQKSAGADPTLARSLAETYLGSASEESAEQGLDLLLEAVLPDDCFPLLEKWVRIATEWYVRKKAVQLLGTQKSPSSERVLNELYTTTGSQPDIREVVLDAMAAHGGASFQLIAETELRSVHAETRVAALCILARMSTEEARKLILQSAVTDSEPKTRYAALSALRERNTWGVQEDQVLMSLMSDVDGRVRDFATRLHQAEDRTRVEKKYYSNWDWSYGRE